MLELLDLLSKANLDTTSYIFALILFGTSYLYILGFRMYYKSRIKEFLESDSFILSLIFAVIAFFAGYAIIVLQNIFQPIYNIYATAELYGVLFLVLLSYLLNRLRINERFIDYSTTIAFVATIISGYLIPWQKISSIIYQTVYPALLGISLLIFILGISIKTTKWIFYEKISKTRLADKTRKGKN